MANYQQKRSLRAAIANAVDELGIDTEDMVTVAGFFGEKGVLFYPNTDEDGNDPQAAVGFTPVGFGPAKHYNMSRGNAAALVELLVNAYDFTLDTEEVPVTTYETRIRVQ